MDGEIQQAKSVSNSERALHGPCIGQIAVDVGDKSTNMSKQETLRNDHELLLNELGFVWRMRAPRKTGAIFTPWMDRYQQLVDFQEKLGHFEVPKAENKELQTWIYNQRSHYRLGKLKKNRQELLEKISFPWTGQQKGPVDSTEKHLVISTKEDELWMSKCQWLCAFQKERGHIVVPRTGETSALAQWLLVQQHLMDRGRLSENKKKRVSRCTGGGIYRADSGTQRGRFRGSK